MKDVASLAGPARSSMVCGDGSHDPSDLRGHRVLSSVRGTCADHGGAVVCPDILDRPEGRMWLTVIIWDIRFPRILMGLFVGASLAITGAALQALVRNPLADPYVLGISSGAALGATIGLALGLGAIVGGRWVAAVCLHRRRPLDRPCLWDRSLARTVTDAPAVAGGGDCECRLFGTHDVCDIDLESGLALSGCLVADGDAECPEHSQR